MKDKIYLEDKSLDCNRLTELLESFSSKESIKQWDLGASCSKDISVQVDKGIAKQLKGSQRNSITIRVWNSHGLVGVTSTSDLTDNGLNQAFEAAYLASSFGNPSDIPQFSPLAKSKLPELEIIRTKSKGIKYLFDLLKDSEHSLLEMHESINSIPYNGIGETDFERIYLNSDGASRQIRASQASIYLYARAEQQNRKPRSSGAVRIAHGIDQLDVAGCIEEAANRTINHLNYEPIETGKYLVCFKPEAFLELINSFSSMFNARAVIDGVSLSKEDSIGEMIATPSLSIYDNSIHPSNFGASPFDGEGTPTQKLCLIDAGILKNYIHSEATARKFGVSPTGHAGLGAKVSVGLDWLDISKTKGENTNNANLLHNKYSDRFILIEGLSALHAGVKASQGSFSLPFDGWLVNNDKKISIEAATIAGDIRDLLKKIVNIEENQIATHQGLSPHVWVDGLTITGEE